MCGVSAGTAAAIISICARDSTVHDTENTRGNSLLCIEDYYGLS
jgi:hypothetical protein